MIVRRKTRQDIIAVSKEDIEKTIKTIYPAFLRFNENNNDVFLKLQNEVFSSSVEFILFVKTIFKSSGDKRLLLLGNSHEEIANIKLKRQIVNAKGWATKIKASGLTKEEYSKIKSHRCIEYWIQLGYSEEFARNKISESQSITSKKCNSNKRKLSSPRRLEYWASKGFDNPKEMVSLWQKTQSKRCVEYWLSRGCDVDDATDLVSTHQRNIAKIYYSNTSPEQRRKNNRLCREFYEIRGYSDEEISKILRNNGTTFSLDICIQKYGDDEGFNIWKLRQEKWQATLSEKPQIEQDRINAAKGNCSKVNRASLWKKLYVPGLFYIIPISDHQVKIGITSRTMRERYGNAITNKKYEQFLVDDVHIAFQLEQVLIREFKQHIRKSDYGPFGWTEVLNEMNINIVIERASTLLEDREYLESIFRKIQHDNTVRN